MNRKAIVSAALSLALCAGMSVTANASNNLQGAMEKRSRQAVAAAIQQGIIPPDSTIFDCGYGEGANGETVVVRYKDDNGNWVDVATRKPLEKQPAAPEDAPADKSVGENWAARQLSEDDLADYEDEVFKLVNEAREQAGLSPLERNSELDDAAAVRAGEYASIKSIRVDGQPHTRLDGSKFSTVLDEMDISWRNAGENSSALRKTPEEVMNAWLDSDGHRANIMTENRTQIGVGVRPDSKGRLYWIQLFTEPE